MNPWRVQFPPGSVSPDPCPLISLGRVRTRKNFSSKFQPGVSNVRAIKPPVTGLLRSDLLLFGHREAEHQATGLLSSGLPGTGLLSSGLLGTGLLSSGLLGTGLPGTGLLSFGLLGTGLLSSGLLGTGHRSPDYRNSVTNF